jgi:hypothetical protein
MTLLRRRFLRLAAKQTDALAKFGRLGLMKDVAEHLAQVFASNLQAALSGRPVGDGSGKP